MILGFLGVLRDSILILWGLLSVLAIIFLILATWQIWKGVRDLLNTVKTTVNDDVKPLLAIGQESATHTAGTVRFLNESAVQPVIRILSMIAGIRRGFAVFTGITGRGKSPAKPAQARRRR